jgi:transposase
MVGKRMRYSGEFKARVALEALRAELTTARLAAKHGINPTMVGVWKRQVMEGMAAVFSGKSAMQESSKAAEAEVEKLHAKIGQLLVERDLYEECSVKKVSTTPPPDEPRGRLCRKATERGCSSACSHAPCASTYIRQLHISGSSMTACHNPACTT